MGHLPVGWEQRVDTGVWSRKCFSIFVSGCVNDTNAIVLHIIYVTVYMHTEMNNYVNGDETIWG